MVLCRCGCAVLDKCVTSLQDITEKRTKDTYGPPMGKRLLVFLDDLNMPKVDSYGTQQPIALLKLLIDRKVRSHDLYDCMASGHFERSSFKCSFSYKYAAVPWCACSSMEGRCCRASMIEERTSTGKT